MNTHSLNRLLDFTLDPRMAHNFIHAISRRRGISRILKNNRHLNGRELYVAFTCDVELAYGSHRIDRDNLNMSRFLRNVPNSSIITTLFVEGRLVKENAADLRSLEVKGVEIGFHGYNHELWGRSQWYLPDKPVTSKEKGRLLKAGIEDFRKAGLKRPQVFRAPNLVIDRSTMHLLVENGFTADSSLSSHKGVLPIPQIFIDHQALVSIPVTADPFPSIRKKGILPYYRYRVFNLKSLKEMHSKELLESVHRVMVLQDSYGVPPHLIILSHSWEFDNPLSSNRDFSYCSPANLAVLRSIDTILSQHFDLKYASVSTIAQYLQSGRCMQRMNLLS